MSVGVGVDIGELLLELELGPRSCCFWQWETASFCWSEVWRLGEGVGVGVGDQELLLLAWELEIGSYVGVWLETG